MKKIVFVVPYEEMKEQILEVWNLHGNFYKGIPNIDNEEYSIFFELIYYPDDVIKRKYDVDTIVARGATAQGLKARNSDIPIVELPISAIDLERAVKNAKKKFGDLKIGVIGSKNMVYAAALILNKEKYDLGVYEYEKNDEEDILEALFKAKEDGCEVVVTGKLSYQYCKKNHMKCQNISTSISSIWQAVTEAKRAATIFYQERHRAMKFKTIVDYAYEGIITFDMNKNVELINDAAAKILGINREDVVGKNIDTAINDMAICKYFNSQEEYDNILVDNGSNKLNLNKVQLLLNGKHIGSVVTFQDMTSILEAEVRIRKKLNKKGHIAKYTFENVIGHSPQIKNTISQAEIYAKAESNILLYGETGTGKEVFAQAIHNVSNRNKGPFVAVNCAALTESLLESELFGYVDGAFTGAAKGGKQGIFEMAHKGTLFLDEISEIPIRLQGRLLRAIQEKEIMRLGDDKLIPVDVRIVCATNKNLKDLVEKGSFREDLYFRLNVLRIQIPPLRQRAEDAVDIMEYYLKEYTINAGKEYLYLSEEAKRVILSYDWRGNIRELRNICECLVALNTSKLIGYQEMKEVLPDLCEAKMKAEESIAPQKEEMSAPEENDYFASVRQLEKDRIVKALQDAKYNRTEAAKRLSISRATLWRKMKELGID